MRDNYDAFLLRKFRRDVHVLSSLKNIEFGSRFVALKVFVSKNRLRV